MCAAGVVAERAPGQQAQVLALARPRAEQGVEHRRVGPRRGGPAGSPRSGVAVQEPLEERVLRPEVAVDEPVGDAGLGGDVAQRDGGRAGRREQPLGRVEHRIEVCVAPVGATRGVGHGFDTCGHRPHTGGSRHVWPLATDNPTSRLWPVATPTERAGGGHEVLADLRGADRGLGREGDHRVFARDRRAGAARRGGRLRRRSGRSSTPRSTQYAHMSAPETFLAFVAGAHQAHPRRPRRDLPAAAAEPPGEGGRALRDARHPVRRPPARRLRQGRHPAGGRHVRLRPRRPAADDRRGDAPRSRGSGSRTSSSTTASSSTSRRVRSTPSRCRTRTRRSTWRAPTTTRSPTPARAASARSCSASAGPSRSPRRTASTARRSPTATRPSRSGSCPTSTSPRCARRSCSTTAPRRAASACAASGSSWRRSATGRATGATPLPDPDSWRRRRHRPAGDGTHDRRGARSAREQVTIDFVGPEPWRCSTPTTPTARSTTASATSSASSRRAPTRSCS